MKTMQLGTSNLTVPVVAAGCMRLNRLTQTEAETFINTCLDLGINFFDHADIYGGGECETLFAKANRTARDKLILQSKCGICRGVMYDYSKEHILASVDGILQRLNTDYIDILLLHRPDALVEPEEVAEAFDILESSGKVRYFGVSNHKPSQIRLLKKVVKQPMIANQLQFSLPFSNMVANGLEVNMLTDGAFDRDGSILDFCRLEDITIQAWSPFQATDRKGSFIDNPDYPQLNTALAALAEQYGVTKTTIAAAWILRHPANMQIIPGTMTPSRMVEIAAATNITLSREDWYKLYLAAGHHILP